MPPSVSQPDNSSLSAIPNYARPASVSTGPPTSVNALTTFPNPFADEPEPGLIPSLLSKVKSTFGAAPPSPNPVITLAPSHSQHGDRSNGLLAGEAGQGPMQDGGPRDEAQYRRVSSNVNPPPTEAQLLAAAVKERQMTLKSAPSQNHHGNNSFGSADGTGATGRLPTIATMHVPPTATSSSPIRSQAGNRSLKPPPSAHSSHSGSSRAPSLAPSNVPSAAGSKRLMTPAERHWRPTGVAPAQVTISPVTSVTTTITGHNTHPHISANAEAGPSMPMKHRAHFPTSSGLVSGVIPPSAHALSQHGHVPSPQLRRHAHRDSLSGLRPRRSSFATIPDSPSSVSLSAMIHNAELSQNVSYVPGFPLGQDDTRSVRSLGLVRKSNSVSKIIRRMRGEGLSKHYWMLDEHCKECYDCKSLFTAWRRKHHCRICGQIFCSRCASNIIGARRFGQEGAVRVCNLCLKIMEEYKDDDEADRRSINSVATSARLPHSADRPFNDSGISPDLPYSKSPFAASQLFSSTNDETLGAIEEGIASHWAAREGDGSGRPHTPGESEYDEDGDADSVYEQKPPATAVPFRRPMDEEHTSNGADVGPKAGQATPQANPKSEEELQPSPGSDATEEEEIGEVPPPVQAVSKSTEKRRRVEFPRTDTISTDGGDVRPALSRVDSNQPLIGLRTRLSSRASQGGLTSLIDAEKNEGLWRARSNSFAKRPELIAGASLHHLHLMLEQAITRANLPNPKEWHRTLMGILLKVSSHVSPNVRMGDSIDVRTYVKIKKIPGGKIADSEYVDGVVITKNVAHKAMPRRLVNPRIMVVTFPLDYHRVENQFMSLDPIMTQEKDYLRLLSRRIIDVRPHVVLVERSASRLALDHMLEAGIAVARSVKLSAIQLVGRCTQADVVASMDRLAFEPRLGRCAEFRIQSFDHEMIPGRRKTLMRFEGCLGEFGCTILLRGGDMATLRKVKRITSFMSYVAYQLKNEVILYNDEHNILPIRPPLKTEYQQLLAKLAEADVNPKLHLTESTATILGPESPTTPFLDVPMSLDDERALEKRDARRRTKEIALSLEPYLTTILSASVSIRFPPPAPLARMADLDRRLWTLRKQRDEDETNEILQEERKERSRSSTVDLENPIIPQTTDVPSNPPLAPEVIGLMPAHSLVPPPTAASTTTRIRDPYRVLRKPEEITRDSTIVQVQHQHSEQYKLWQLYNRRHNGRLDPADYQHIIYLYSLGSEGAEKPCVEPTLGHIDFYRADDQALGDHLAKLAKDARGRCPDKSCEKPLHLHFQLLVHGDRRLQIAMDPFACPSPGHEEEIITWSYCRICTTPSPTTIIREDTYKMSWGSYLEQCFYPPETSAGFSCGHDAYRDQIRYFAHLNFAIRIHNEPIELYDPVRPSISLQSKAETKVALKNQEYEVALQKNAAFFDSVLFRLRSFDYDICHPEKIGSLHTALEAMLTRAVGDREEMVNLLNRTYKLTPMTDVLALNTVLRTLQDKVVQWDTDFADIEKTYLPSEKDLRRMTASHLKRLFANQDGIGSLDRSVAGLTVSEVDEKEGRQDGEGEKRPPSELSTPGEEPSSSTVSTAPSSLNLDASSPLDDGVTPTATVATRQRNPLSIPGSPDEGGESDSTIGKTENERHPTLLTPGVESSEVDSDAYFVSRIPRRTRPAPSIADLVKRFQESSAQFDGHEEAELERPRSGASIRHAIQHQDADRSDSDTALRTRPRLRRGKTDQPVSHRQQRDLSSRAGMISDGDRSYAHNASRAPHHALKRESTIKSSRPGLQHRRSGLSASPSHSGRTSPDPGFLAAPSTSRAPLPRGDSKSRLSGKGKAPRSAELAVPRASVASVPRPGNRRSMTATPSSRVTSIARHFDRLSRDAERERIKRNAVMRNKRARPVAATKVKVQVFDNVRDAFRDESDSDDSSEADNEEDEDDDIESDADGNERSRSPSKSPRKSPKKEIIKIESPEPTTQPMPVANVPADSDISMPISASGGSIASSSILSDARSEISFTDRLKISLPSFETSAPLPSVPATPQLSVDTADEGAPPAQSQMSQMSESELSSGGERSSILKTLTGLWAFRAGDYTPLEYPLSAAEHIFADSKVIIRENEPTSIIAFTLSSKMYRDKMKTALSNQYGTEPSGRNEAFMPDDHIPTDRTSAWDIVSLDEALDPEEPLRPGGGTHLKYDFDSGSSNIFCRIFFAEQFAALRSACHCEDSFVESLARCVQFDASGGKSGSAFLKTKDDRFICKEISRLEMDALTKFAPAYFDYTKKAFQGQRPTVLAKIYGFFKIGFRNAVTGRAMRMNVLVMENLFYERRFSKIYDLKGSTRNRLIQATGRINEVLLDENLMEIVYKHPLYLREHSKRILRTALFNDTLFLSNLNVMDYSLVVGVDSEKRELVVGIVDYIRTFTWDKKLESWVKDSAFLGGAGKGEPTIVTPKQYKARFRAAMERFYFPSVPDRWSVLGADENVAEEDGNFTTT